MPALVMVTDHFPLLFAERDMENWGMHRSKQGLARTELTWNFMQYASRTNCLLHQLVLTLVHYQIGVLLLFICTYSIVPLPTCITHCQYWRCLHLVCSVKLPPSSSLLSIEWHLYHLHMFCTYLVESAKCIGWGELEIWRSLGKDGTDDGR